VRLRGVQQSEIERRSPSFGSMNTDWLKLLGYLVFSAPGVALVAFGAALGGSNVVIIFLTPLLGAYLLGRSHGAEALMKVIRTSMKEPPER